ncbi:MAG: carboxypeptidase regulatory-like domain-containing protein [Deltaproteobacteria bacterium]|nr:carboxypeptidase regulatory-like domain-containing protein [Deltaproteobacteria bacterium]
MSNRLLALSVVSLVACAANGNKEPAAPSPVKTTAAAPVTPASPGAPATAAAGPTSAPATEATPSTALDGTPQPPEAGKGTKEAFDGPGGVPSIPGIPTSIPGLPSIPGAPTGVPTTPGGATVPGGGMAEGLNFKLPPCPPMYSGLTFGAGVTGTVLMPKGDMALGAAKVTLVNSLGAEQATTITDGCGRFRFDAILPGVYKVRFAVRTFKGESSVNVPAGGTHVDVRVDVKFLQVGVFQGSWDKVEKILDKVGVPYQLFPNNKLESTDLSKFNIVFINCNETSESTVPAKVKEKLKAFVNGGGALYVSDRALPYVTATWPGQVNGGTNSGNTGTHKHTVFDFQLGSYLRGALTVPIIYDLGGWRRLSKDQPGTTLALLRDEKTQEPAIVTFASGGGFVGYTTYHQGAQMNDAMTFSLVFFITRL